MTDLKKLEQIMIDHNNEIKSIIRAQFNTFGREMGDHDMKIEQQNIQYLRKNKLDNSNDNIVIGFSYMLVIAVIIIYFMIFKKLKQL